MGIREHNANIVEVGKAAFILRKKNTDLMKNNLKYFYMSKFVIKYKN
ncbi:hypothetical protein C8P70_1182 [Myroides indicus]|uniref:Uncharacterized protein n=1 Tax=Myroides indicus TaxID=1323422 RepID=A0A4R7EST7_9FLAO|nr:hypothetical protein C8P70_1182 [Myroides indicus]